MKILVLNGSPRENGQTKQMIKVFEQSATMSGNEVTTIDVMKKNINDCMACEYCHTKGNGECIQKDDMTEIYNLLKEAEMLVIASPIYYHGITGKLKCAIDRFYSSLYPKKSGNLKKVAMFLASGDPDMYEGAKFSFDGDFLGYLRLENMGIYTNHDNNVFEKIREMGKNL